MMTLFAATLAVQQTAAAPASLRYSFELALTVEGMEGKLVGSAIRKVKAGSSGSQVSYAFADTKLSMSGQEQDLPEMDAFAYKLAADGGISGFSGGVPQTPAPAFCMLMTLYSPKEPLAVDASATLSVKKEGEWPAVSIELKRLADESYAGEKMTRFQQKSKAADGSFDYDGQYWVKANGDVFKIEQKINSIKVGDGGSEGKGKFTFTLKKS